MGRRKYLNKKNITQKIFSFDTFKMENKKKGKKQIIKTYNLTIKKLRKSEIIKCKKRAQQTLRKIEE